jgi:hypothetical protein
MAISLDFFRLCLKFKILGLNKQRTTALAAAIVYCSNINSFDTYIAKAILS